MRSRITGPDNCRKQTEELKSSHPGVVTTADTTPGPDLRQDDRHAELATREGIFELDGSASDRTPQFNTLLEAIHGSKPWQIVII
ncbi:hypothetical protein [Herbaspirillum sp. CF444]|uniref:hypothetical protein n=1 Tax=Herbaspirillum sp. CF444 TaxID=1144319 RepID=UPI0012FB5956|nr:hypothetical protein [Herbaspirillum sp. CF444]